VSKAIDDLRQNGHNLQSTYVLRINGLFSQHTRSGNTNALYTNGLHSQLEFDLGNDDIEGDVEIATDLDKIPNHELRANSLHVQQRFRLYQVLVKTGPEVKRAVNQYLRNPTNELRTLTVREMARIQSFPDAFEFRSKVTTGGKMRRFEVPQYTQVGNAVPPLLGRALASVIHDILALTQDAPLPRPDHSVGDRDCAGWWHDGDARHALGVCGVGGCGFCAALCHAAL